MRNARAVIVLMVPFVFCSCLAAGVPYSSNPRTIGIYGNTLASEGRVFQAEQMYNLALEKYMKKNDNVGVASIYIRLGVLYGENVSWKNRPVDCSESKHGAMYNCADPVKALEFYEKAVASLQAADESPDKNEFLRLAHMHIARQLDAIDDKKTACTHYKIAFESYQKAKQMEPNYEVQMRDGSSFDAFLKDITKDC